MLVQKLRCQSTLCTNVPTNHQGGVLKMAKTQKILGVLFFWLIIAIAPVHSEKGVKDKLFLKSGRIIECDKVWIPEKDIVRCKKGRGMLLYSIDDVDLKRTFGEAFGEFPITTGEEESRAKEKIPASIPARKTVHTVIPTAPQ